MQTKITVTYHSVHLYSFTRTPQVMDLNNKAATGALLSDHGSRWKMADGARSSKGKTAPRRR